MKVLFWMDPFIDIESVIDRSFSAMYDINPDFLGRASELYTDIDVYFCAISDVIEKRGLKERFVGSNVQIISLDKKQILEILDSEDCCVQNIINNNFSENLKKKLVNFFSRYLSINFDLVITWEFFSPIILSIYPNAIFLAGHHTGMYRFENGADVIYRVGRGGIQNFQELLNSVKVTKKDREELCRIKTIMNRITCQESPITKESLQNAQKFDSLVFYPGNYQCARFDALGYVSNEAVLQTLLDKLPENVGIVFTNHPLSRDQVISNNPRIIDLTRYQKADADLSVRIIRIVDAVVNVYSSINVLAYVLDTPVFTIGEKAEYQVSMGNIDDLSDFIKTKCKPTSSYLENVSKYLKYEITKKLNIRFLRNSKNIYHYLKLILENAKCFENSPSTWLPSLRTLENFPEYIFSNLLIRDDDQRARNLSYEATEYEELLGTIINPSIKNIGFDVFDTLLQRPFFYPQDIFETIQFDVEKITGIKSAHFAKNRMLSEEIVRRNSAEVTLDDIYQTFKDLTGLPDEHIERIKSLEIQAEFKYLRPRYSLKEIFELAKLFGKQVFIASDMYLSSETIRKLLELNKFDLAGVDLFISCELNLTKHTGTLFDYILKTKGFKPQETLFVGDNTRSDVEIPKRLGISTFFYPKSTDIFKETKLFEVIGETIKLNYSHHLSFIANKIFDNPFIAFDKTNIVNNSSHLLGYLCFGPFTLALTIWLAEKLLQERFEKILFSSRDSYVIINIYEKIRAIQRYKSLPISEYIHLSRKSTLPAYADRFRRLTLLSLYATRLNVRGYLKCNWSIDVDGDEITKELIKTSNVHTDEEIGHQLPEIAAFLTKYYETDVPVERQSNIVKYIEQVADNKRFCLFDLGTRGTSRDALEDLTGKTIPLYFFRSTKYKQELNATAYVRDYQNPYRPEIRAYPPVFYELLLSDSIRGTCLAYEFSGEKYVPVLGDEQKITLSQTLILSSQHYTRMFVDDFIEQFGDDSVFINKQAKEMFLLPISYLAAHKTDAKLLLKFDGSDPFFSSSTVKVIPIKPAFEQNISEYDRKKIQRYNACRDIMLKVFPQNSYRYKVLKGTVKGTYHTIKKMFL